MEAVDAVRDVGDNMIEAIDESAEETAVHHACPCRGNWISVWCDLAALEHDPEN